MNTYMHNWNNYQKINCEWVSSHATMHSLTDMHAWSGSTLSVCMSPLLYPPRHTHKPSFLKGFTVHSGGSETTGHVKMQMIKTEESGNVIRYIKKTSTFEKPKSQTGIRYISTAHQKTSSLGGAESDKRAGNTTTQLQLQSLPSNWCLWKSVLSRA